jgi:methylthioribose-1-phosphate isomerase
MSDGLVNAVIVGADRIATNGDVANKIGTYHVALAAHAEQIPFYVAAPWSTIDLNCKNEDAIPIENRADKEISHIMETQITPNGVKIINPAFDLTPFELISGIITERGIIYPPFSANIKKMMLQ